MSTTHVDISYDLIDGIYDTLINFIYKERDQVTLTGTSGTADITCHAITRRATFHTSLTVTASDFVTAHAAAYLAAGVVVTSSAGVIIFTGALTSTRFTGSTSIAPVTTNLTGTVAANDITYPVYKSIPKPSAEVYVHIHNVIHTEDGTKDDFVYAGTVQIEVVDESKHRGDRTLSRSILGVVRGLLKTSKASVFTVGSRTLVIFSHASFNEFVEAADQGIARSRLIDIYNFLIE